MTKKMKIAEAAFTAAIEARYAARDKYFATGEQADLIALNEAVKVERAASAALAEMGR